MTALAKEESQKEKIGPRVIDGYELRDVEGDGNCFYDSVASQLNIVSPQLLQNILSGTDHNVIIRARVQGAGFNDQECADDQVFDAFVRSF